MKMAMKSQQNLPSTRSEGRSLFGPFDELHDRIDRLFSDVSRGFGMPDMWGDGSRMGTSMWGGGGRLMPSMEMHEADGKVMISAELPGVDEKDIDISVQEDMLTISGEKKAEVEHKEGSGHRTERTYGSFSRSVTLPFTIEPDKVEARFDKGVLKLTIPRPAEARQNVKKIQIKH
jgi:HSP20 family protein